MYLYEIVPCLCFVAQPHAWPCAAVRPRHVGRAWPCVEEFLTFFHRRAAQLEVADLVAADRDISFNGPFLRCSKTAGDLVPVGFRLPIPIPTKIRRLRCEIGRTGVHLRAGAATRTGDDDDDDEDCGNEECGEEGDPADTGVGLFRRFFGAKRLIGGGYLIRGAGNNHLEYSFENSRCATSFQTFWLWGFWFTMCGG